jgi:hypothetical protein
MPKVEIEEDDDFFTKPSPLDKDLEYMVDGKLP